MKSKSEYYNKSIKEKTYQFKSDAKMFPDIINQAVTYHAELIKLMSLLKRWWIHVPNEFTGKTMGSICNTRLSITKSV